MATDAMCQNYRAMAPNSKSRTVVLMHFTKACEASVHTALECMSPLAVQHVSIVMSSAAHGLNG